MKKQGSQVGDGKANPKLVITRSNTYSSKILIYMTPLSAFHFLGYHKAVEMKQFKAEFIPYLPLLIQDPFFGSRDCHSSYVD